MYIIGIDPGKTGAAAYIYEGQLVTVFPFKGDINNCRRITENIHPDTYPFIEKVNASSKMGVVSAFTFGRWTEAVETAIYLSKKPYHMVRPQVWQNAIGIYSQGDKSKLYDYAKKLFPTEYKNKTFNKATSDAVLIAYYGWRYMNG